MAQPKDVGSSQKKPRKKKTDKQKLDINSTPSRVESLFIKWFEKVKLYTLAKENAKELELLKSFIAEVRIKKQFEKKKSII